MRLLSFALCALALSGVLSSAVAAPPFHMDDTEKALFLGMVTFPFSFYFTLVGIDDVNEATPSSGAAALGVGFGAGLTVSGLWLMQVQESGEQDPGMLEISRIFTVVGLACVTLSSINLIRGTSHHNVLGQTLRTEPAVWIDPNHQTAVGMQMSTSF